MEKIVLIFGGGRDNIGFAAARRFQENGYKVLGADINFTADVIVANVYDETHECDIACELDVNNLFEELAYNYQHIDVIINSAGINRLGTIEDYTLADFMDTIDVNLVSQFLIVKAYVNYFDENGKEKTYLAVTSDTGSFLAKSATFAYGASKAGANGFLQCIARDLDKYHDDDWNILIFAAGMVEGTPMDKRTINDLVQQRNISDKQARALLTGNIPKGRGMTLNEAADWIYFLCTKGKYASGNLMRVDNFQQQG